MATFYWVGMTPDPTDSINWSTSSGGAGPAGPPGASDKAIFDNGSSQDCTWTINVQELDMQFSYIGTVTVSGSRTLNGLTLAAKLDALAGAQFTFSGSFLGGYDSFYVLNKQQAKIVTAANLTYIFQPSAEQFFDDGPYPIIHCNAAQNFSPAFKTPTSATFDNDDDAKLTCLEFQVIHSSATFGPVGTQVPINDRLKIFKITGSGINAFKCVINTFDAGHSTWEFLATTGGFSVPCTGNSSYGTSDLFKVAIRSIKINADTAGHSATIPAGRSIICEELVVSENAVLKGPTTLPSGEVHCVSPPTIKGSWNLSQVAPGIYRSPLAYPISSVTDLFVQGAAHITGKLTVDGLIDPTGLELSTTGANPGGSPTSTIWCDGSTDLYFGALKVMDYSGGGVAAHGSDDYIQINKNDALWSSSHFVYNESVEPTLRVGLWSTTDSAILYLRDSFIKDAGANLQIGGKLNLALSGQSANPGEGWVRIYAGGWNQVANFDTNQTNIEEDFETKKGRRLAIDIITGTTTLDETNHVVICNFGSETDVNLPIAAQHLGREYIIRTKSTTSKCVLKVAAASGDKIDNDALVDQIDINASKSKSIVSDGSGIWYLTSDK